MTSAIYACLQDEDKIAAFGLDADTGQLTQRTEVPAPGGPSVLAISSDRRVLYVGHRSVPAISSFSIDQNSGGLTLQGTVSQEHAPTFLATDQTGKYLLCAYYQGGFVAVHPLDADGAAGAPPVDRRNTAPGAHSMQTDPSNKFAFVPHIARLKRQRSGATAREPRP
jgi:6-phosphogluconolactonase